MNLTPTLNRKLVLQERVSTPDGSGGYTVDWVALGTLWTDMRPIRGNERVLAGRRVSSTAWRITTRAGAVGSPSRPRPDQRFVEGERVFNILAVAEIAGNAKYLECWAEEGILE